VRIDCGVEEGDEVSPHYDPMIAKLIVHAPSREAAAARLATACGAVEVWPVRTNAAFLARAAAHPDFVAGRVDTGFIPRHGDALIPAAEPSARIVGAAAAALAGEDETGCSGADAWRSLQGFRINAPPDRRVAVDVGGRTRVGETVAAGVHAAVAGERILFLDGEAWPFGPPVADRVAGGAGGSDEFVVSPMPGRVIAVLVCPGDTVTRGQTLILLEAMKMEHPLNASFDGVVEEMTTHAGAQVAESSRLARIVRAP
jgi:3-methylcrotonyl-CoA carboxylase alpha subunit